MTCRHGQNSAACKASFLQRFVMRWRYNKLKEMAGTLFLMSIKYDAGVLELQHASKLVGEAADAYEKLSRQRGVQHLVNLLAEEMNMGTEQQQCQKCYERDLKAAEVASQPLNDLLCACKELIDSWETRAFETEKSPKEYVRGISSGMKICIEELAKKINYT